MKLIMENWRKHINPTESSEIENTEEDSSEVVKLILVNSERKVLFLKRSNYVNKFAGEWDLPGGHLKIGEALMDGLQREVEEETSLKVLRVRLFTKIDNISFFESVYEQGSIVLSNEHTDHKFINPFEFKNPDKFQKIAQKVVTSV